MALIASSEMGKANGPGRCNRHVKTVAPLAREREIERERERESSSRDEMPWGSGFKGLPSPF